MKMNKIGLFLVLILGVLMLLLYMSKKETKSVTKKNPTTIKIWVQEFDEETEAYYANAINRFQRGHADIHVDLQILKGSDLKVANYISTSALNNNYPDVLLLSLSNYNLFTIEDSLLDLTEYMNNYGENYFLNACIDHGIYNDKLYGIAYALNPEVLVYRKDLLDEIDYDYPTNVHTLEDLQEYLIALDKKYKEIDSDTTAFAIPSIISNGTFISSFLNHNKEISQMNTVYSLESNTEVFHTFKNLYKSLNIIDYHYSKLDFHPFFLGKAAVSLEPMFEILKAVEKNNKLKEQIQIIPLDQLDFDCSYSESRYISLSSNSNHKEEAFKFLTFFLSDSEVATRYQLLNQPIIINEASPIDPFDSVYYNNVLTDYIDHAFHYAISKNQVHFLKELDSLYEKKLHGGTNHNEK